MATTTEIEQALTTLAGARLRNAPAKDEAPLVAQTWRRVMADIPGPTLLQAVDDLVLTAQYWPTVREVRDQAQQVRAHNGSSAAANQFRQLDAGKPDGYLGSEGITLTSRLPAATTVTAQGWQPWQPGRVEIAQFPPAVQAEIERLEQQVYSAGSREELPSDDELARIDRLARGNR